MGQPILSIEQAKAVLAAHGFKVFTWARSYRVMREIPPYGSRALPFRFHRSHRGFGASDVSITWVRKLAAALLLASSEQVTSRDCADAWAGDKKAADAWGRAGYLERTAHRDRPDYTLEQLLGFGVAEIKAAGAARMAQLTYQVLLEAWQEHNPIGPLLDRMGSDKPARSSVGF
jgi:hypothetical protein